MFHADPPKLPHLPHHSPPAIRRPQALPKAPIPLSIGDQVTIGGVLYTVGAGLIPVGTTPPPPVPPVVTGYSANPVAGGAAFTILGSGFTAADTAAFDTGAVLPVTFVDAAHLTATAPKPTAAFSSAVVVTAAGVSARGPILTVTPTLAMIAIFGFRDASRNWLVGTNPTVAALSTVFIEGANFGPTAGTVTYAATQPVALQKWTDTEITITAPTYSGTTAAQTINVRRPDGTSNLTLAFGIAAPLPVRLNRQ